jgi:hypothetical protein
MMEHTFIECNNMNTKETVWGLRILTKITVGHVPDCRVACTLVRARVGRTLGITINLTEKRGLPKDQYGR